MAFFAQVCMVSGAHRHVGEAGFMGFVAVVAGVRRAVRGDSDAVPPGTHVIREARGRARELLAMQHGGHTQPPSHLHCKLDTLPLPRFKIIKFRDVKMFWRSKAPVA